MGHLTRVSADNTTVFFAASVQEFMKIQAIEWIAELSYAHIADGISERILGKIKQAIKTTILQNDCDWAPALPQALYDSCRREEEV